MAKRSKKTTINGHVVTVYELSVRQIRNIIEELDSLDNERVLEILSMCSDVTVEQIEDMAPSDIRQLWDVWAEVNADFLHLIRAAMRRPPIQKAVDDFLSAILTDVFAALPSGATAVAGSMDGDFSNDASSSPTNPTGTRSEAGFSG
jgi:hypothetical protein